MLGADALALIAPGEGEAPPASGWRSSCCEAAPRPLLERRRRARARVKLVQPAAVRTTRRTEDIGSKQVAEVTLPRAELDEVWSAEYLERFARTYWRFLTRVSLGLLRVLYTETSREVVLLTRPFVLLRFRRRVRDRGRRRHGHLADRPRACWWRRTGAAAATCGWGCAAPAADEATEATAVVTSEVVNFYPRDRRPGLGRSAASSTTRPSCAST